MGTMPTLQLDSASCFRGTGPSSFMSKSQLHDYARKAGIAPPVYKFAKDGPSHAPTFKATVIVNNAIYESPPGFSNLKSAERAAAKVALDGLWQSTGKTEVTLIPVFLERESGFCKNLLQEYAHKNSLPTPLYQSQRSGGPDHFPTFTSIVEIAGRKYSGGFATNKKGAEIKAARTALLAIQASQSPVGAVHIPANQPLRHVATGPAGRVGLATLISRHLNNTSGKKRRHDAADASLNELGAERRRLKTDPYDAQGHVHVQASAKGLVHGQTSYLDLCSFVNRNFFPI